VEGTGTRLRSQKTVLGGKAGKKSGVGIKAFHGQESEEKRKHKSLRGKKGRKAGDLVFEGEKESLLQFPERILIKI